MPSIVMLAGLGNDPDMFDAQAAALGPRFIAQPWIAPRPDEDFRDFSRRFLGVIRERLDVSRPFVIGGLSFGGMVAAHMAEVADDGDVCGLALLSACTRRSELSMLSLAVDVLGITTLRGEFCGAVRGLLNHAMPAAFSWNEAFDHELALRMEHSASRMDMRVLRWASRVVANWTRPARPRCPIWRAHGRLDRVVPFTRRFARQFDASRDLIIPHGRHMLHWTHPDVVNRWLEGVGGE